MSRDRLAKALREAIPWLAFAAGDPSALDVINRRSRPSLADQTAEILATVRSLERRWSRT
jgi:hypothetical protein